MRSRRSGVVPFLTVVAALLCGVAACSGGPPSGKPRATATTRALDNAPPSGPRVTNRLPRADFNGDGYNDVAVDTPGGSGGGAGGPTVVVMYGNEDGLDGRHRTVLTHGSPHVAGQSRFGLASSGPDIAWGDLDDDGYTDLAISRTVYWGGPDGVTSGTVFGRPTRPGLAAHNVISLAIGDFNGDSRDELAVAWWGVEVPDVWIYVNGFTRKGPRPGIHRLPHDPDIPGDMGGLHNMVLTAGDATGDDIADLLINPQPREGATNDRPLAPVLLYEGTRQGLRKTGVISTGDSVVLGDIDHDGYVDIAVGDSEFRSPDPGLRVSVTYGSPDGPGKGRRDQIVNAQSPGIRSYGKSGFAPRTIALGDTNGDGYADLAIGFPGYTADPATNAGRVLLLPGSGKGLVTTRGQVLNQDTPGVPGRSETRDRFGERLLLSDVDNDGRTDLVVSAPGENKDTGSVLTFRGTTTGLSTDDVRLFAPAAFGAAKAYRLGTRLAG